MFVFFCRFGRGECKNEPEHQRSDAERQSAGRGLCLLPADQSGRFDHRAQLHKQAEGQHADCQDQKFPEQRQKIFQ